MKIINRKMWMLWVMSMLLFSVFVGGCGISLLSRESSIKTEDGYSWDFDVFSKQAFTWCVSRNENTLRLSVEDRSAYGIEEANAYWADYTLDSADEYFDQMQEILSHLQSFKYDDLTDDQKTTYVYLNAYLAGELSVRDDYLLNEQLAPMLGEHNNIPFYLSLYPISNQEDLDRYMSLVKDASHYIQILIDFQTARSEAGLFMQQPQARDVISECSLIIEQANIMFVEHFDARIEASDFLTEDEKDDYQALNRQYVEELIIPAYEDLIEALEGLMDTSTEGTGLSRFEGGQEYYQHLVEKAAGTGRTVDDIYEDLDVRLDLWLEELDALSEEVDHSDMLQVFEDYITPDDIIMNNIEKMRGRFPMIEGLPDDFYEVYDVPIAFEDVIGGMYVLAPVDNPWRNNIYIGNYSSMDLYQITSHEAMPGHLYKMVYFLTSDIPNKEIRYFLAGTGQGLSTEEGWTTYIENISFEMAGLGEKEIQETAAFQSGAYAAFSMIDIGIHYYGWTPEEVQQFISEKGLDRYYYIDDSLLRLLDSAPVMYLPYIIGYMDVLDLLAEAQDDLGEQYSEYDFHKFCLDTGYCTFDILQGEFDIWLEEQNKLMMAA